MAWPADRIIACPHTAARTVVLDQAIGADLHHAFIGAVELCPGSHVSALAVAVTRADAQLLSRAEQTNPADRPDFQASHDRGIALWPGSATGDPGFEDSEIARSGRGGLAWLRSVQALAAAVNHRAAGFSQQQTARRVEGSDAPAQRCLRGAILLRTDHAG